MKHHLIQTLHPFLAPQPGSLGKYFLSSIAWHCQLLHGEGRRLYFTCFGSSVASLLIAKSTATNKSYQMYKLPTIIIIYWIQLWKDKQVLWLYLPSIPHDLMPLWPFHLQMTNWHYEKCFLEPSSHLLYPRTLVMSFVTKLKKKTIKIHLGLYEQINEKTKKFKFSMTFWNTEFYLSSIKLKFARNLSVILKIGSTFFRGTTRRVWHTGKTRV